MPHLCEGHLNYLDEAVAIFKRYENESKHLFLIEGKSTARRILSRLIKEGFSLKSTDFFLFRTGDYTFTGIKLN